LTFLYPFLPLPLVQSNNICNKEKFTKLLATPLRKKKGEADNDEGLKARRRGALGLAALCEAHPYDVPSWMPSALEQLALHLRDPKPIDGMLLA
jgi:proteasome activator subunit 4